MKMQSEVVKQNGTQILNIEGQFQFNDRTVFVDTKLRCSSKDINLYLEIEPIRGLILNQIGLMEDSNDVDIYFLNGIKPQSKEMKSILNIYGLYYLPIVQPFRGLKDEKKSFTLSNYGAQRDFVVTEEELKYFTFIHAINKSSWDYAQNKWREDLIEAFAEEFYYARNYMEELLGERSSSKLYRYLD